MARRGSNHEMAHSRLGHDLRWRPTKYTPDCCVPQRCPPPPPSHESLVDSESYSSRLPQDIKRPAVHDMTTRALAAFSGSDDL